jgi:hypothetical protein
MTCLRRPRVSAPRRALVHTRAQLCSLGDYPTNFTLDSRQWSVDTLTGMWIKLSRHSSTGRFFAYISISIAIYICTSKRKTNSPVCIVRRRRNRPRGGPNCAPCTAPRANDLFFCF